MWSVLRTGEARNTDGAGEYSVGTQGALMNDRETTIGTAPTRGADGRQESKRERLLCLMTAQKQI